MTSETFRCRWIFELSRGRILGRNWDISCKSFPPCYSQSPPQTDFPLPHLSKSGLKLTCNVNIVYENLKSENFQDYAQKPQGNCMFMNSAPKMLRNLRSDDVSQKSRKFLRKKQANPKSMLNSQIKSLNLKL